MTKEAEMLALLPCPFCGGEAHYRDMEVADYVTCTNPVCEVVVEAIGVGKQDAFRNWNTRAAARPSPDAGLVEREALAVIAETMFDCGEALHAGKQIASAIRSHRGANVAGEARACTCHPDDDPPVPCAQKYALTDCRAAIAIELSDLAHMLERVEGISSGTCKWLARRLSTLATLAPAGRDPATIEEQ